MVRIFLIDLNDYHDLNRVIEVAKKQFDIGISVGFFLLEELKRIISPEDFKKLQSYDFMILDDAFLYVTNIEEETNSIQTLKFNSNIQIAKRIQRRIYEYESENELKSLKQFKIYSKYNKDNDEKIELEQVLSELKNSKNIVL